MQSAATLSIQPFSKISDDMHGSVGEIPAWHILYARCIRTNGNKNLSQTWSCNIRMCLSSKQSCKPEESSCPVVFSLNDENYDDKRSSRQLQGTTKRQFPDLVNGTYCLVPLLPGRSASVAVWD